MLFPVEYRINLLFIHFFNCFFFLLLHIQNDSVLFEENDPFYLRRVDFDCIVLVRWNNLSKYF